MGIYKRGGRWWIDFRFRGRRYREPAGHHREVAVRLLAQRRLEVEGGSLAPRREIPTLRAWSTDYMDWSRAQKASWKRDRTSLLHLLPALGERYLDELTPDVIERYQRERRRATSRYDRPPSAASINREVACLRKMLSRAVVARILRTNPSVGVKMLAEDNERSVIVTEAQLEKVLRKSPAWLRPIVLLGYHTGMRRSEIVLLRWDQVDLPGQMVRLRASDTKTREPRSVPLAPPVVAALKKVKGDGPRVFTHHPDTVTWAFTEACKAAGLPGVRFHDLRHTAVTRWADAGYDPALIMKASGHKTMSMFRRYRAASEQQLRAMVVDTATVTKPGRRLRSSLK